jgi:SAM-dependent methyltransferase
MACIICRQVNTFNILQDYCICFNCFHISKYLEKAKCGEPTSNSDNNKNVKESCNSIFLQYLFKEIEEKNIQLIESKSKINVVSINGSDTVLLDLIKSRFSGNVKTISISENFNPSYFSEHKCYKLSLDMYTDMDNYDTFDVIILNGMCNITPDPIHLLKKCKTICNSDGYIYSMKLNASVLLSRSPEPLINTRHIWTTHSVKKLCQYSEMLLSDIYKVPESNNKIYKIAKNNDKLTTPIVEDLYDEMCYGFYNIALYQYIKHWNS